MRHIIPVHLLYGGHIVFVFMLITTLVGRSKWHYLFYSTVMCASWALILYIMERCEHRASCRSLFKEFQILPLKSQYVLSLLMFVVQNKTLFLTNTENYNLDTRQRNNLYLPQANLTIYQKGAYYLGIKIFNNYLWRLRMLLVTRKNLKLLWKNSYTLIHFTPWKSTLVSCELGIVLQNSNIVVYWFKIFWHSLDKHAWIVISFI